MKKIMISCISLLNEKQMQPREYSSEDETEKITIEAIHTNEATEKFLLKKLGKLDKYFRVQSNSEANSDNPTMKHLDGKIEEFCKAEGLSVPENVDFFLGEDENEHRYDRVLSEIAHEVRNTAADDPEIGIYLDVAGGKRDNFIFIQLLTKLLSYYGYDVHAYYADITGDKGVIVNTDLSFEHMKILDAVNEFARSGSVTSLRGCFRGTPSPTVKALLKAMQEFSDAIQLCNTDLTDVLARLNQQLDETEKNVTGDDNGLFAIKTMIPMIRSKFSFKSDNTDRSTLALIRWCLENNLIQQALTIYNERVTEIIFSSGIVVIDEEIHSREIGDMMKGQHISKRNGVKLRCILGKAFDKMYAFPELGTKELEDTIKRYNQNNKQHIDRRTGKTVYHILEWTIGSMFFSEAFLPEGVKLNIDAELFRKILSDNCYVTSARNRVNHALDFDGDKVYTSLFYLKSYPFSSYPNKDTFTPNNIRKDMLRAIDNLEDALDAMSEEK